MKTELAGGIESVVEAMNIHINNASVCENGCGVLWNMSDASTVHQKEVCKNGGLAVLLKIMSVHSDNEAVLGLCCGAVGAVLSSPETHSMYCTPETVRCVETSYKRCRHPERIREFLCGIKREEDPRVCSAVARGTCTKEGFPKCSRECQCDENYYCPKCCVQQRAFRCHTCDTDKVRLYCETCWKRDHEGHEGEEFFCPVRCASNIRHN